MKILIDIGHPAHVHLFKNLYFELITRNYKVIITVKKNIDSAIRLLDQNNIPHIELSNKNDSILGKLITQLKVDFQLVSHSVFGIGRSISEYFCFL